MSQIISISPQTLDAACIHLSQGDLVGIPTETVYGLAADATQDQAVAKIFTAKGRPTFNPLIIHVADISIAHEIVEFNPLAEQLSKTFWPGPLTLVLKKKGVIADLASAGLDTLAIRIPNHPAALALLQQYGKPLAAPSANRSNTLSPTCAEDVALSLGTAVSLILDGGATTVGLESTIIDLTTHTPTLLRPGGISVESIEEVTGGPLIQANAHTPIKAPGMLSRHYAPETPLRLNVIEKLPDEVMLGFGPISGNLNLSPSSNLTEAAANLFSYLRILDRYNATAIAVAPIPFNGLGLAINDRLKRATS